MKIFLTGANGLLGSHILVLLKSQLKFEIKTISHTELARIDLAELKNILTNVDVIIHCAAATNVEKCEVEHDWCFHSNCFLTEKLSICSQSQFMYISSTGVYGAYKHEPYHEYDVAEPTTVHHKSKLLGENLVLSRSGKNVVIRTGWLYGDSTKNDFVEKIVSDLRSGVDELRSNKNQYGCPTYAGDVAEVCLAILDKEGFGIFNVVNEGSASRFDYVSAIAGKLNYDVPIIAVDSAHFGRKANVSDNEMATSLRLKYFGVKALENWKTALEKYIDLAY